MRLIEIRLLEGPNVYRLEPVVKLELAIGRRRTFYGERQPGRHALVRLGATVPARAWPDPVAAIVAWIRRLRSDHGEGVGGVAVHRSSDPGHWIVTFPWTGEERARTIAEAALALAERDVSPSRTAQLTGHQERAVARWSARIAEARTTPPPWLRDEDRRIPIVSISGTNGKSTVTRLITHILVRAGRKVGTTTSDGVLVDERLVDAGDWTGPGGAAMVLARSDVQVGVLETARGGIVLRGVGYESNDASVLTNVSSDHLDLQGIHTLPELAEVKSVIARITKPDGWVVLNGDDPLVAAVRRRVRGQVALFSTVPDGTALVRRHAAGGGRGYVLRDGLDLYELEGRDERKIVDVGRVPITIGGIARHNVANVMAAAGAARGLGATIEQVRRGLVDFRPSVGAFAGATQPVPARSARRDRRLRPQRGGRRGRARRRRGDRRRRGRSHRADHGHRGDGRRPPRRHAPRDRADRREAGAAGRDQGDAQVPPRAHPLVGRRRDPRGDQRRRREARGGARLRVRDRGVARRAQRHGPGTGR